MLRISLQNPTTTDPGDLRPGLEADQVSPGVIGFLVTFLLVVAVVLLILDLVRRQRRLRYRAEYARRREAEERGEIAGEGSAADPDGVADPGIAESQRERTRRDAAAHDDGPGRPGGSSPAH